MVDRALSIAGRVAVAGEHGIESRLVSIDRDLLVIPSLAIHMDRNVNAGKTFNVQEDMLPVYAQEDGAGIRELAAGAAGVQPGQIVGQNCIYMSVKRDTLLAETENGYWHRDWMINNALMVLYKDCFPHVFTIR